MAEPKPLASLSPGLLARKGGARPAMRPQLAPIAADAPPHNGLEDLGWNDMGHDHPTAPASPTATPATSSEPSNSSTGEPAPAAPVVAIEPTIAIPAPAIPPVVEQQREVARRVAVPRRSALAAGRRAAFTLRLDAERHLRLRLASAVSHRSAQQLVTEALDRLLDELPDLTSLAAQVAAGKRK